MRLILMVMITLVTTCSSFQAGGLWKNRDSNSNGRGKNHRNHRNIRIRQDYQEPTSEYMRNLEGASRSSPPPLPIRREDDLWGLLQRGEQDYWNRRRPPPKKNDDDHDDDDDHDHDQDEDYQLWRKSENNLMLRRMEDAMKRKILQEMEMIKQRRRKKDERDEQNNVRRAPSPPQQKMTAEEMEDEDEDHDHDHNNEEDDLNTDLDPSAWRKRVIQRQRFKEKKSASGAFMIEDQLRFNFTSIGGYIEIKEELVQLTDFMRNPGKYEPYNVRLPKGILLYGAPGTGKTLFARCVAGECNIPFISTSGSEFQEKYVGMGAARVRELFEFARENTPCMIFIDELDGIGRHRGADAEAAQAERDQTLNQLLVELDGFRDNKDILMMGSTNRMDILDPALLRPGRIDKHIHVNVPDFETRCEIINIHIQRKPINATTEKIAKMTAGWTGAQIENLLNEATLYAIRKNELPVMDATLEKFADYTTLGKVMTPLNLSMSALWRIAVHEMGHTLVAMAGKCHEKPIKCTIVSPNGRMAGYTTFGRDDQKTNSGGENDNMLLTKEYLVERLQILLGGRIAEELVFGSLSISSGASHDLEQALELSKKMVVELGMGKKIIYARWSQKSLSEMDEDISQTIQEAYDTSFRILKENIDLLRFMSQQLLFSKTLESNALHHLVHSFQHLKEIGIYSTKREGEEEPSSVRCAAHRA